MGDLKWQPFYSRWRLLKAEDTSELEQTRKIDAGYNKETLKMFLIDNASN